jgi:hypothetical protein
VPSEIIGGRTSECKACCHAFGCAIFFFYFVGCSFISDFLSLVCCLQDSGLFFLQHLMCTEVFSKFFLLDHVVIDANGLITREIVGSYVIDVNGLV